MKNLILGAFGILFSITSFAQAPSTWIDMHQEQFKNMKRLFLMKDSESGRTSYSYRFADVPENRLLRLKLTEALDGDETNICFGNYRDANTGRVSWAMCSLTKMGVTACSKVDVQKCIDDNSIAEDKLTASRAGNTEYIDSVKSTQSASYAR